MERQLPQRGGWIAAIVGLGLAGVMSGGAGCSGDDSDGSGGQGPGTVQLAGIAFEPELVTVGFGTGVGEETFYPIQIRSAGNEPLRVEGVWMDYAPVTATELEPAFRLASVRGCKGPGCAGAEVFDADAVDLASLSAALGRPLVVFDALGSEAEFTYLEAVVSFRRPPTAAEREGLLKVRSNADGFPVAEARIRETVGLARIEVAPLIVDFDIVQAGESDTRVIGINNAGTDELVIDRMEFQGSDYFRLFVDESEYGTGGSVVFDPPIVVTPQASTSVSVSFTPLDGQPSTGTLRIFSNDTQAPANGVLVELRGNTSGPCIALNPSQILAFGPKPIGQLSSLPVQVRNCGNAPLLVYDIYLTEGSAPDFRLEFDSIPQLDEGQPPTDEEPLRLEVNQEVPLTVVYIPEAVSPQNALGEVIPDIGTIVFRNNTFDQLRELEVRGVGVDSQCPEAVLTVPQGDEVIPQTVLTLFGDASKAIPGAVIEAWEWRVEQASGNSQAFQPSSTVPNPTFEVNVAGIYRFELDVWDSEGRQSCQPATYDVAVIPDQAVHVELTWITPNDPDPTDEGVGAGTDLDLHFAHPYASTSDVSGDGSPDPWFDQIFDCFWFNKNPDWEVLGDSSYDPSLDRDDTDGWGPENLNLDKPVDGRVYRIGVHYWNDHDFGASFATVRIYLFATLAADFQDVYLEEYDMWEVGTLTWPSGAVEPMLNEDGEYRVIPMYLNPAFPPPG